MPDSHDLPVEAILDCIDIIREHRDRAVDQAYDDGDWGVTRAFDLELRDMQRRLRRWNLTERDARRIYTR